MIVVVAADHAGFPLVAPIVGRLNEGGHEVVHVGATGPEPPLDYPDVALEAAIELIEGRADRAVLLCGSGVGVSVAANKVPGVRAAQCSDTYSARQGVEHDDANMLAIGARVVGPALALELVDAFIGARFRPQERFVRRAHKLAAIEGRFMK